MEAILNKKILQSGNAGIERPLKEKWREFTRTRKPESENFKQLSRSDSAGIRTGKLRLRAPYFGANTLSLNSHVLQSVHILSFLI